MKDSEQRRELSAELVGYALGLCDDQDRRRVEAAVGDGRALKAACQRIEETLSPLQADESAVPPAHLVASILDRVEEARNTIPFPKRGVTPQAPVETGGRGSMFNIRELVGLAAAIALFIGIFVPGYRTARSAAQRTICADNLRLVGNGYASYAEMFGSPLPYVQGRPAGANWLAKNGPGVRRFNNTSNTYMLVSKRLVAPERFICPGRPNDFALQNESPESLSDFPDSRNNGYATMAVSEAWHQRNFDPQMPVASDMNPLVDDAADLNGPIPENSHSHGGRGQNVLRGNISVAWSNTARAGLDNDDIYRLIGVEKYTGQEWPRLRSDAFLIP